MEQELTSSLGRTPDPAGLTEIAHSSSTSDPLTSDRIPILPNELLATIFEAGARSSLQDVPQVLPFIITVSHVNRHWRDVAHSFPDAWCYVPVYPGRDAMTELFLARSEGRSLYICIHYPYETSALGTQRALALVEPSAPRWVRLCIRASNAWAMLYTRARFGGNLQDLVRLRALELRFDEHNGNFIGMPVDVFGTTPCSTLESVTCVGTTIKYQSPVLRGLTRLILANLHRPSHEEFRQLCLQNPHLEYLKLENVFPTINQSPYDADEEWRPFVLNSLRTLELVVDKEAEDRVGCVERFFGALTVPTLCELLFKSHRQLAWEDLGETIWKGGFVWDHVRTLHLVASGSVNFRFVANSAGLFRMFPKLEHFTFRTADDDSALSFLQRWIFDLKVPDKSPQESWRKLKSLTIRMPENDGKSAGQKTAMDSLKLLEALRLWNGRYFKLYVW